MYRSNINALPAVQNENSAASIAPERAAAIIANTPISLDDVVAASMETRSRKRMRIVSENSVTDEECALAEIREHVILSAVAANENPEAVAPVWFGLALAPIQASIAAIVASVAAVEVAIAPLSARVANQEARRQNKKALKIDSVNRELAPLHKLVAGIGRGLPGHRVVAANVDIYAVGEQVPLPHFPIDRNALQNCSHAQLSMLSAIFNETFGVVRTDSLVDRMLKFQAFIS